MDQGQKRKDITKVAKLYYYGNMTQDEIAQMMGISRPKVSRMLAAAHQYNIVHIEIRDPLFSNTEVAEKIRSHFDLKKVVVVPTGQNPSDAKDNIGKAASEYLNSCIVNGMKIGISWGTTLNAFVNRFQCAKAFPDANVIQLVGASYSQSMHMDGRELVKTLARKLNCQYSLLQAPMLVHNPTLLELFMEEPETIDHFNLLKKLDIAFVGLGSSNYKNSVVYKAKYLDASEAKKLSQMELCDICGHQIDIDGKEPETILSNRLISIPLNSLAQIPMVMGLCAGNDKTRSIISAIHGGYLNGLIIDEIAAISLLEAEKL
ncbi:sugar-binding transcriptional regulator [Ruminococcus gauvreauii]|uniref:Uncharacterized protein n=1 Tax=Ruminococcus gauvreauii TaxID=438033 RepID=A0ABY5VFK5_9FIRM|nr:sugar-binding domain-containing protein [Ruminococcus gauvreauii]UWP58808.1 hypothetical protein NQ502_15745 [Ruminococcus gauvreauii]